MQARMCGNKAAGSVRYLRQSRCWTWDLNPSSIRQYRTMIRSFNWPGLFLCS